MRVTLLRRPANCSQENTVVAIGNFDGIHLGHQAILAAAQHIAKQQHCIPVMLTFEPYPQQFFDLEIPIPRLTTLREKVKLIKKGFIYALPFDAKLSSYSPEYFMQAILINKLQARYIVVGEDFRFGYQRAGNVTLLSTLFHTEIMPPVILGGERISSTRVRHALLAGDLHLAEKLLGRPYSLIGKVVKGNQRGRQLGFPTANIALHQRMPPLKGVFVVRINHQLSGVANIGTRPTVDGTRLFLEVYIFDFNQDIYNHYIEITFMHKLRDEMRFDSIEALKQQIAQDVMVAKSFLALQYPEYLTDKCNYGA